MRSTSVFAFVLAVACADEDAPMGDASSSEAGSTSAAGSTTTAITTTTGSIDTGTGTGTGDSTGGDAPMPMLPTPTGTCPELADGEIMFAPAGIEPRAVRLWMSDAAHEMDGPFVFYWHGTGSQPEEALYGLGASYIDDVVAQGGIIAAPFHDPAAGDFPWYLVLGQQEDDLVLADEVLACAIEQVGVDASHIHTIGMSAGGLMTSQMSFRRSGYIASAVPYSGGFVSDTPPDQDPSNPLSAMIFHGGDSDVVIISFQEASERYLQAVLDRGGFGFICNHGMGHTIPQGSAQASVWQFFFDHPFGTTPSPYIDGLPDGFPDYCTL